MMEEDVENEKSILRETSNTKSFTKKIFQNVLQILHSQETGFYIFFVIFSSKDPLSLISYTFTIIFLLCKQNSHVFYDDITWNENNPENHVILYQL
jgi:hypothetical protein